MILSSSASISLIRLLAISDTRAKSSSSSKIRTASSASPFRVLSSAKDVSGLAVASRAAISSTRFRLSGPRKDGERSESFISVDLTVATIEAASSPVKLRARLEVGAEESP